MVKFIAILVVSMQLIGCSGIKLTPFENAPDISVISSGFAGVPPLIMDPNVFEDKEGTHLFYSTYFCKLESGSYHFSWDPKNNSNCNIEAYISALGYAFSSDNGYNWAFRGPPVFSPGGEEWEQYKVETAFVLNNGTTLQLYYSAIGYQNGTLLDNRYQLGVSFLPLNQRTIRQALLDSEDVFLRYFSDPLVPFDTVTSSFTNNVQEPSVVIRDNLYEVFFLGLQFSQPAQSPDTANQTIEQIGLGKAVFDLDFKLLNISTAPLGHTKWLVNIPEVRYSSARDEYILVSASLGSGEVHQGESIQLSYSHNRGDDWTLPVSVFTPPGGEVFNGWATTSPTLLLSAESSTSNIAMTNSTAKQYNTSASPATLFYSAFSANYTSNNGACDFGSRYGIPVPDPACLYITLGRAVGEV